MIGNTYPQNIISKFKLEKPDRGRPSRSSRDKWLRIESRGLASFLDFRISMPKERPSGLSSDQVASTASSKPDSNHLKIRILAKNME
jgi:hypothetical protein